jgi:hypothetical protein
MPYYTGSRGDSHENQRTSLPSMTDREGRLGALGAREAFITAYPRLCRLAAATRRPAVLVAVVSAYGREVRTALIEPGHSLILGRHTRCGLLLPTETLSLRHLAAHARLEAAGADPVLHLWDLNTDQPFLTEDGQPSEAVISRGMLYAAVGEYALVFMPTRGRSEPPWPARAEDAWWELPPRQFIDRSTPLPEQLLPYSVRIEEQRRTSDITREKPLQMLYTSERSGPAWGALTLELGKFTAEFRLSLESLERGVLLGRYARCAIPLSPLTSLSRVHLMLVRVGQDILAVDTASTCGTRRGWRKIETIALRDSDTLLLPRHLKVHWRRLPSGATTEGG